MPLQVRLGQVPLRGACIPALSSGSFFAVALLVYSGGDTEKIVEKDAKVQELPLGPLWTC